MAGDGLEVTSAAGATGELTTKELDVTARPAELDVGSRQEVAVLVLGREGAGKTALVHSLEALRSGEYPKTTEKKQHDDPLFSMSASGGKKHLIAPRFEDGLPLVLTDSHAMGAKDQIRLSGGRRLPVALRSGSLSYDAALFVIDATARPIWEDPPHLEEMGQFCSTLRQQGYHVVIAVTKLERARAEMVRESNHGADHGGRAGRDPRSSYEVYVSRYIEKVSVALQGTIALKLWQDRQGPEEPIFPHARHTIFDVPAWTSRRDYQAWQERKGTPELPNLRYVQSQLEKLCTALSVKPRPPAGSPGHHFVDDFLDN